jgi:hypothetical protein
MLGGAVRKLGNRDTLFDLGADFAGMVLPGGTIVVKLIDKLSRPRTRNIGVVHLRLVKLSRVPNDKEEWRHGEAMFHPAIS